MVWRDGVVKTRRGSWKGAVELEVELSHPGESLPPLVRALAYPALVGEVSEGDRVLLTAASLARGLGTGGFALVVAVPDRLPADDLGSGHVMKARYTPLQYMALGVEEPESPHRSEMASAEDIGGMPVVVADLHSALPAIVIGVQQARPDARIAIVHSDGGALPVWFSRTLAHLRELDWIVGVVSAGQSFGGDVEAVNVYSGLVAARHALRADIAIVAQGPGNLGTGTPWGFSGVAVGEHLNAVSVLRGSPVAALRVSAVDPRVRHRGVSHHSLTAIGRVALQRCRVPVPLFEGLDGLDGLDRLIETQIGVLAHHDVHYLPAAKLIEPLASSPITLSSMGRGFREDLPAFLAPAVAGEFAASL